MKVIAYDPYINETAAQELNVTPVTLEQLLKGSDLISVHCPLTKDTYHLIGKEEMTLLKPNAILVNTARGGIIDEAALIEALQTARFLVPEQMYLKTNQLLQNIHYSIWIM